MNRWTRLIAIFLLSLLAAAPVVAQNQGTDVLLSKARSLEARGRMDLAAQNWRQILLVNPNQSEALAGLARYAKENGETEEERTYLDRLRKADPKNPAISQIEKMHVITPQERNRLDEAGRLAMQHKPDEAMKIYNEVFGDQGPTGKWAEPYYETEAASTGGRTKAIAQLRRLSVHDPGNELYRLWLARALVNDPKTRMEGLQLLESLRDPGSVEQARTEWRQALLWEKQNPAVLESVNAYLARYPDQELQGIQKSLQEKRELAAEDASKERGFQALRNRDMSTAESKFQDVLRRSPNDANAVAGLAFVRLNQKRFDEAVELFERARTLAPKRADVREGYETAKFWSLMEQGSAALQRNAPEDAITEYQQALQLHPRDEQAMMGIAQAYIHEKKLPEAETELQQVLNQSPNNADVVASLAFIRVDEKRFDDAVNLFEKARRLAPGRADVAQGYKDAKYWSLMQQASAAGSQGRTAVALSDYQQALSLRPGAVDALRGLAGASERSENYSQAAQAYTQLASVNSADPELWLALIRIQLRAKNLKAALDTAQRIPATVRPQLEARSDYLSELALANYATNQPEAGDRMLRRAIEAADQSDSTQALNARLEIASALVQQGKTESALSIYQQATRLHPDNVVAWQALVGAYASKRDFPAAKMAVRSMPQAAFDAASKSPEFLGAVAAVYSADGECGQAEEFLNRALNLNRTAGRQPAENMQLQLADIWRREGNDAKARQGYREIVARDPNSLEAWRGYITTLHTQTDDRALVSESQHIPASVRAQLEKDPAFLVLLASAEANVGQSGQTVQLLQQARTIYESQGQTPSAELDVQLAWAMLNDRHSDPRLFLQKVRARTDLTNKQRAALDDIWSSWSIHRADEALQSRKPDEAIAILSYAQRDLPNDPKLYAATASIYAKRHEYQKALSVYQAWGLAGGEAGDYRAAAGAALAAHKNDLADSYLAQGVKQFPDDPGLLEMRGKQAVASGHYEEGQYYLKSALRATRNPARRSSEAEAGMESDGGGTDGAPRITISTPQTPACKATTSYLMPEDLHVRLASWTHKGAADDAQDNQGGGTQSAPAQNSTEPSASQNNSSQNDTNQNNGNQNNANQTSPNQSNPDQPGTNQPNPGQNNPDQNTTQTNNGQPEAGKPQQIQDEIDVVQNRNTPYSDIGSVATGRAGDAGIDRLIIEDGVIGGSVVGADKVRLSLDAHGLYLYSGTPDGQSRSRFGTLAPGTTFGSQSTGGVTGELQLSTATFGLDFSATPNSFPVQNVIGGLRFRPLGGPITFTAIRDSVKDSLLSYAGVRDPGTGTVWGGVVSNTGTVQVEHKNRRAGQYVTLGGSYLTGKNVPNNWNAFGNAGFFVVVAKGLSVGLNVTGMHYDKNLSFFSLGQGGYFSPQQYGLASIPIDWFSRHKRFEYQIRASLGAQYIQQDRSVFFPVGLTTPLAIPGFYASNNSTGANYSFLARVGYRVAPHVYFDVFGTAGNARNYATQTVGFSLKFMVRRLPTNTDLHVNSVPDWKGNQPFGIQQ